MQEQDKSKGNGDDGKWLSRGERDMRRIGHDRYGGQEFGGLRGLAASRESALGSWLGSERQAEVFSELRPLHENVDGLVDQLLSRFEQEDALTLSRLQAGWEGLFGRDISRQCSPLSVKDGILTIEVNNPTCLYVFERQQKGFFAEHLSRFTGGALKGVEFVPRGSRRWQARR